jgi:hypothetical protein
MYELSRRSVELTITVVILNCALPLGGRRMTKFVRRGWHHSFVFFRRAIGAAIR